MRLFVDERNPDRVVSEYELCLEFLNDTTIDPDITFEQHLANCMDFKNGTLREVINYNDR